jgi:hypothetical protein
MAAKSHGHKGRGGGSPTYSSWQMMKSRCQNPNFPSYEEYGKRGVLVCERWQVFENFLADMGERPSLDYSIDRFPDKTGKYEPGNCRWATRRQQNLNRKSTRPVRCSDGRTFPSLKDAAEVTGGNRRCIWDVCNGNQGTHLGLGWNYVD